MTAKELYDSDIECFSVTVCGFDFFITADIMTKNPVVYVDGRYDYEIVIDNSKEFRSTEAAEKDIEKQIKALYKKLHKHFKGK